jgi:hypothetical protein
VFGDAGKQLELGHGKAEGGVGGARRPAHGPAQPGYDIGQFRTDLLAADLIRASINRARLIWADINRAGLVCAYINRAGLIWAGLRAGLLH